MGLDATLCKHPNYDAHKRYEKVKKEAHERIGEQFFKGRKYDDTPQADKDGYSAATARWDADHPPTEEEDTPKRIEENSKVYPDHMFKIGYLRSSYNDGGINSILRNRLGKDLYYIFGVPDRGGEDCHIKVDWPASLKRAQEIRDAFARDCNENGGYAITKVALSMLSDPKAVDEKSALELFRIERKRRLDRLAKLKAEGKEPNPHWDGGSYSNIFGLFHLDEPLRVAAIICGTEEDIISTVRGMPGQRWPATYVIYESAELEDKDGKPERPFEWYQRALEITVELCEFVLAQPDIDQYRLAWSG